MLARSTLWKFRIEHRVYRSTTELWGAKSIKDVIPFSIRKLSSDQVDDHLARLAPPCNGPETIVRKAPKPAPVRVYAVKIASGGRGDE